LTTPYFRVAVTGAIEMTTNYQRLASISDPLLEQSAPTEKEITAKRCGNVTFSRSLPADAKTASNPNAKELN
jgi:hypothetical protein